MSDTLPWLYGALILTALAIVLPMRGGAFHTHLAHGAAEVFEAHGLKVRFEHPLTMPDGRLDYVDLWVTGPGAWRLIVEVETTARYVLVNLEKAACLGHPIWIVVPTRALRHSIARRIERVHPRGLPIEHRLLLPDAIEIALVQRLTSVEP